MTLNFPSAVDFGDQSKCDYRLIESFRIIQNDTKSFRLILNPRQFKFTRTATDTSPFLITLPLHVLKADVFSLWGTGRQTLYQNDSIETNCTETHFSILPVRTIVFFMLVLTGKPICTKIAVS